MVETAYQVREEPQLGDFQQLVEKNQPGYHLRLKISPDEMSCLGDIEVLDRDQTIRPSELLALLARHGIADGVDEEQVALFCSEAAKGSNQKDMLLGSGKAPTKGDDGWFEIAVRTADDTAEFNEDDKGNVDFKTRRTFSNIVPGQKIGVIHPPTPGNPGRTVLGMHIPALLGNPMELIAGTGVVLRDGGTTAYAEMAGRAIFEDNRLSISEEYIIDGNLDLSVGNIDFQGFVEVRGDVLDDFSIKATKGIQVKGSVGACRLESGGPVNLGSMAGTDVGMVICHGDFSARYLNAVKVECHGHVRVTSEIRNSSVKAAGRISVEKGIITGGECVALEGIEAKQVGALSGGNTRLVAGVLFTEEDRLAGLKASLASMEEQIKRIRDTIGPLSPDPSQNQALREAIALRVKVLNRRLQTLQQQQDEKTRELKSFKREEHPTANPKINISQVLREGVVISFGKRDYSNPDERNGARSIIENTSRGGLRFLPQSSLKVLASVLEAKALEEERATAEEV